MKTIAVEVDKAFVIQKEKLLLCKSLQQSCKVGIQRRFQAKVFPEAEVL